MRNFIRNLKRGRLSFLNSYLIGIEVKEVAISTAMTRRKNPLYFGYWALEIAALVKVLNIPDDSFKNHKYYPYDLVHFGG
ncbi:PoNe immunity protein domain-containing protein [Streptococcus suis]|uniref:PoNe immunity protein domain-containing protein n=1 Tax=Streptococcus suis TaxID=1307 RepID=UPI003D0D6CAA